MAPPRPHASKSVFTGPSHDEHHNYYSDSLGVELGHTYDLAVELEDGRTVEAAAKAA